MAMAFRTLISKPSLSFSPSLSPLFYYRSFASKSFSLPILTLPSPLVRLRPLVSLTESWRFPADLAGFVGTRCFSTRPTTSSLNDPSPNWSNRPPKETILLDGCDFEHWLVVVEPPEGNPTRDEIIDSYIKTLAEVVGSEDEARKKIYSVSTKCYFAFGALVSEEVSYKIKALPKVRWVLPDSYLDVRNKDYGGEPFIDGKAVPYDPKYHEEWIRNNARANERSRRNDRPRNFDRSRNFERRRENMQNRDFQRDVPPMPNQDFQNRDGQNPMPPRDVPPMPNRDGQSGMPPTPDRGFQSQNVMPPRDMPTRDVPPGAQYPNRDVGSVPPNRDFQGRDGPSQGLGGMPNQVPNYQNRSPNYQGTQMPNRDGGNMPTGNAYPGGGGFQGSGNAYPGGGGFQGGGNAYQGGVGIQGDGNAYQGGGGYQGGGNAYGAGGGGAPGSGNGYQGGGGANQGSGYSSQAGDGAFQGGGNAYQGTNIPPNRQY